MGKKCELTSEQRAQIQVLRNENLSLRAIALRLGIAHSTVSATITRMNESGRYESRHRTGRPRVTSKRTDNIIRRAVQVAPTTSSNAIASSLAHLPVVPSARTIRRRLSAEMNLKSYRAARKPRLSQKNIADRLAFAIRYKDWTAADWEAVMFSDECTVCQFQTHATTIRRPPNSRYNKRYVLPTVKHPESVMIWGSITARGRAGLWFLPPKTTMNAKIYLDLLKEKLPEWMARRGASVFQQDGAPCHTAKTVKAWFQNQPFQLLEGWPGSSPDLNVIENCWATVKRKVSERCPSSYTSLCDAIKEVWVMEITPEYCNKLVSSMPSRIQAVIAAKGGVTKY